MFDEILVLIDFLGDRVLQASLECCGLARRLSSGPGKVTAVVLGSSPETVRAMIERLPVDRALLVGDPLLGSYTPEAYTEALEQIVAQESPDAVLMGHTYQNMDLAPRLAARIRRALVTDCVAVRTEENPPVFVRPMFHGKLNADIVVRSPKPWLVTIQSGAFPVQEDERGNPEIATRAVRIESGAIHRELLEEVSATSDRVDLTKAEIIVGVGRGVRKQENLALIEDLASALGAEIGASRPIVDNGWLGRDRQIGSSGQTVSPKLYVAVGISGAIQHVVGIRSSGCIVAINSDPHAPIFNVAAYGIVGDMAKVVPLLSEKIHQIKTD
jgi:electron transfer flavoprotein alpha subunit